MTKLVVESMAKRWFGVYSDMGRLCLSSTLRIETGSFQMPLLANVEKAPASSSGLTSDVPRAIERFDAIGEVMPIFLA